MTAHVRIGPEDVTAAEVAALRTGAIVAQAPVALIDLAGAGAVSAFQGLLTQDIEKPGDGAFIYGALLTPKGMVLVEGWAARQGTRVSYTVPAAARDRTMEILTRYVPPRLARSSERSESGALRLVGPRALTVAQAAGIPLPAAGRAAAATAFGMSFDVAQPGEAGPAPFALQITAARAVLDALTKRLTAAGAHAAQPAVLELARILTGWPSSSSDLDDKTLPQEIRFDDIGGVSYTKGCYTGQETVSRLHFRGHANRSLRGLLFEAGAAPAGGAAVVYQDKDAGTVSSTAWLAQGREGRWIGLALLRREVTPGAIVRVAGTDARVVDLPFAPALVVPA